MNKYISVIFFTTAVLFACSEKKTTDEKEHNNQKSESISLVQEYELPSIETTDKWQEYKPLIIKVNSEVKQFKINDFMFIVTWKDSLCVNENKSNDYYRGIKKLDIIKDGKTIQTIENIKDEDGLAEITLNVFDFNFDGYFDFTLPLNACGKSCYYKYYLFNPKTNNFISIVKWNYVRIKEINYKLKQIETEYEGNSTRGVNYIYQIKDTSLVDVKNAI